MSTTGIHQDLEVLFSRESIRQRVMEMGRQIDRDYAGEKIVLVGVLKGAAIFLADLARSISVEHWLEDEERWDDDPPGPSEDEEILAEGYAPWEVRIPCPDHRRARELADQLATEGYGIVRRWRYVIAGCASKEDADALAERLHGSVEPGGEQVWDALQGHPFAVIGAL